MKPKSRHTTRELFFRARDIDIICSRQLMVLLALNLLRTPAVQFFCRMRNLKFFGDGVTSATIQRCLETWSFDSSFSCPTIPKSRQHLQRKHLVHSFISNPAVRGMFIRSKLTLCGTFVPTKPTPADVFQSGACFDDPSHPQSACLFEEGYRISARGILIPMGAIHSILSLSFPSDRFHCHAPLAAMDVISYAWFRSTRLDAYPSIVDRCFPSALSELGSRTFA